MTPAELTLAAIALVFGVTGSLGWGLYVGEKRAREAAEMWFRYGRSDEPKATIRDPGSAEERALEETEEYASRQAITRLQRWIQDERPGVDADRAREEATRMVSEAFGAVGEP